MNELHARKKIVVQEMEQSKSEMLSSLQMVKRSILRQKWHQYWIEKYPLHVLGTALLTGFVIARKMEKKSVNLSSVKTAKTDFFGMLKWEIKRAVMQRTIRYMVNRADDVIDQKLKK